MIILGMMSGTSTDGIDAVVVRIEPALPSPPAPLPPSTPSSSRFAHSESAQDEGEGGKGALQWKLLKHVNMPFPPALRQEILACLRADTGTVDRLCALNFDLGETYAEVAQQAMRAAGLDSTQIDLIGNHGQTVWHIPEHSTLQIGSPAVIAERTGVTVISNFRARDIAAGGHGAPLVSFVDALLFTDSNMNRALQNIGGIANVTYLPARAAERAFAFDSGPGNVLIDEAVRRATDNALTYDDNGELAAQGSVNVNLLNDLLTHPYFKYKPPKTTGRELFGSQMGEKIWNEAQARGIIADDLIATLTMLTAKSIADAYRDFLPTMPAEVIVSGGGAKNPTLLKMLQSELEATRVRRIDEFGIPADAKEALAFAILAYMTWQGRPSNLPAATGAQHPVILGDITPGWNWRKDG